MKVLFISTGDTKYGAPKSLQKLMSLLIEYHGVECVLLTKKKSELNIWCDENLIENYSIWYRDIMSGDIFERKISNSIKHSYKYFEYLIGGITQQRANKLPIDFNSFDLIHTNSNRIDIGAYISIKYGIPHIWHLREMDEGTKNMHYYFRHWQTFMNNSADCFIAITEAVSNSWIKHGLNKDKIEIVYNGVDANTIKKSETGILHNKIIKIVSTGRVERAKGQLDVVKALCDMQPDEQSLYQLDLIGDWYDDYKRLIIKEIENKKCKSVIRFLGYKKDIGDCLKDYDIGITCSSAEAFGRTTIEYMLAGLLTIASNTGANPELIDNFKSGVLYENNNFLRIKEILLDVRDNRDKYIELAENGHARAKENFSAAENANKIYDIYCSVVKKTHESIGE